MLVKPVEKPDIVGVLGDNKYEVNSSIAAGKYKRFMVDGGNVVKDYELKVGDYFCADGNLVSRDCKPEELPDNCIGIVYYVGNPQPSVMYKDIEEVAEQPLTTKIKDGARDVLKRDYPNCVHGLVFALSSNLSLVSNVSEYFFRKLSIGILSTLPLNEILLWLSLLSAFFFKLLFALLQSSDGKICLETILRIFFISNFIR